MVPLFEHLRVWFGLFNLVMIGSHMFKVIPTVVVLAILLTNVMVITVAAIGMLMVVGMYVHCPTHLCEQCGRASCQLDKMNINPSTPQNTTILLQQTVRSASSKSNDHIVTQVNRYRNQGAMGACAPPLPPPCFQSVPTQGN